MPLALTESEPFLQKTVHLPLALQLRAPPWPPGRHFSRPPTGVIEQLDCTHIMIDADSSVGLEHESEIAFKAIR